MEGKKHSVERKKQQQRKEELTETTSLPPSPSSPTSGNGRLDSLLPGYLSRPQPSPRKKVVFVRPATAAVENEADEPDVSVCTTNRTTPLSLAQLAAANALHEELRREAAEIVAAASVAAAAASKKKINQRTSTTTTADRSEEERLHEEEDNEKRVFAPMVKKIDDAIAANLPLPPYLQQLETKFHLVIKFHDFFQRMHLQCSVKALQQSMHSAAALTLDDLNLMAALCPEIVHVVHHVSASELPQQRRDAWRSGEEQFDDEEDVEEDNRPSSFFNNSDNEGQFLVSLVDSWKSRHDGNGRRAAIPPSFIEQLQIFDTTPSLGEQQGEEEEDDGAGNGVALSPENSQKSEKSITKKRHRAQSAKSHRMAWQFRKALVKVVAYLQQQYFDGADIPAVLDASRKKKVAQRRSKAGIAAAAVAGAARTSSETTPPPAVKMTHYSLDELIQQGRWHPVFSLHNIAVINQEAVQLAAHALFQPPQHHHHRDEAEEDGIDTDDALQVIRRDQTNQPLSKKKKKSSIAAAPPQLLKKHPPCTDTTALGAPQFLTHLQSLPAYQQQQIVHVEHMPVRAARYAELSPPPPPPVTQALLHRGVTKMYSHQVEAIHALRSGKHTVVATSTASGKSLCYVVPILEALAANPAACALFIFPTKALAQDQLRALRGMAEAAFGPESSSIVDIYDGDTPASERGSIRGRAQLLLTNPDMLHVSILPTHSHFSRILSNLTYCVVDEAHTLKGVFGSHSAMVLRRLRRLCRYVYCTDPVFAVTTATVANPGQHACTLIGVDAAAEVVVVVDEDGSPHGAKDFVLWNCPLKHPNLSSTSSNNGTALSKRREAEEAGRAALRAARQERNSGVKLIKTGEAGEKGEDVNEHWTAAVGVGQRDAVVKSKIKINTADPQPQSLTLTVRQQRLIKQASAALSAAAGPYHDPTTLPKVKEIDTNGGGRGMILVGPQRGVVALTDAGVANNKASLSDSPPLTLKSKVSARYGSAGVSAVATRTSPIVEMASLLAETVQHGLRTIAFCKTRKLAELVTAYVREILAVTAPALHSKVAVYRAGYSAAERREIEAALFSGALLGVAATNALELGVDIGGLDATLHLGFPGSIASLWQQAGRAGRREQPSISIYIGWEGPLDQYFLAHPEKLFSRPIEAALVDVTNPCALQAHITCAAYEAQLNCGTDATPEFFGSGFAAAVASLQSRGILGRNLLYTGPANNPASKVTLRAIDPGRFSILDESCTPPKLLEEVEESKVFYQVHDGSTYFYQGRTYLCRKLDLDAKLAFVRPVDVKYYTKSVDFTAVQVMGGGEGAFPNGGVNGSSTHNHNHIQPSRLVPSSACVSAATVTTRWLGFVRIWRGTGQVFDSVDLFLPDVQYATAATYLRLPLSARRAVEAAGLPYRDGVHAASHAVLNALPLFIMANPQDVATECDNAYDTRYKPERILIYDKHPGGIGLAAAVRFDMLRLLCVHV